MALTSVAEARTYLGLAEDADRDTILSAMIDAAQVAMQAACGRTLEATATTEYLDGTGQRGVWLNEEPLSITSVHESSGQEWTDDTEVDSDDYVVRGCKLEKPLGIWINSRYSIRVVYVAGLALDVPAAVKQLCWVQVSLMYTEWQAAKTGQNALSSISIEGWSQSWLARAGLDAGVKAALSDPDVYAPARL